MSIRKLHKKSLNKAQQGRDFRYRPRYMPLNYGIERGGLNIADAFNVLKSGFQDFFGGQDANSDGFKDGLFRDMKEKRQFRKDVVLPRMYDYKVMYDEDTTPGTYEYDAQDLFEASKFGNRLLGKNVINPTGDLNYSNDPNDPNNTFFTGTTITAMNRDSSNAPEGITTLTPGMTQTLINESQKIAGLPVTDFTNRRESKKFGDVLKGIGSSVETAANDAGAFFDRLGNNLSDVYNKLIEQGEITLEDIENKTENFTKSLQNFYQTQIKDRLNLQYGGMVKPSREYDQMRLLEIADLLKSGKLTESQKNSLTSELQNISSMENQFLGNLQSNISNLDDAVRRGNVPDAESSIFFDPDGSPGNIPGGGFVRPKLLKWLEENQGMGCNTYACSILNKVGYTYPINMEPFEYLGQTYKGGDPIAVIPGNLAQDSRYDYKTGREGFVFVNDNDVQPGDYGRIGYPQTNHAILYTGDKDYEGNPISVYNPGSSSRGLKVSSYYTPFVENVNTSGQTDTVRYIGNTNYINELMGMLDGIEPIKNVEPVNEIEAAPPKGQYGFNFQGTPIPIFEDQTTYTVNPNFDFASLMSPLLQNQPSQQFINDQADLDLQMRFPDLGPTPAQQEGRDVSTPVFANTEQVQVGIQNPAPPEVQGLKVKRDFGEGLTGLKNRAFTALNRIESSVPYQAFVKGSDFAVGAASVLNDMFQSRKFNEVEEELQDMRMADNQFGVSEITDRGLYDTNTGLLRPDMSVTTSYGKDGGEVEVDDKTLKQLIAAGADIEIIE